MAKPAPIDCKRLTAAHLTGLDDDQLGVLVQRVDVQNQALNRAMRLVAEAVVRRRGDQ